MTTTLRCRAAGGAANCTRADCPEGLGRKMLDAEAATLKAAASEIESAAAALEVADQAAILRYLHSLQARGALVRNDVKALSLAMPQEVETEDVRAIVHHHLIPVVGWLRLMMDAESQSSVDRLRMSIDEYMHQLTALLSSPEKAR